MNGRDLHDLGNGRLCYDEGERSGAAILHLDLHRMRETVHLCPIEKSVHLFICACFDMSQRQ